MRKKMVDPIYRLTRAIERFEGLVVERPELSDLKEELREAKVRLAIILNLSDARHDRRRIAGQSGT